MNGITILTVTKDADWLIGMRPALHAAGRGRLVVAESVEEADRLLEFAKPRLIVVDWGNACCPTEELASLLWRNSIQPRPASVMIVADEYRVDEATQLFRLGVDEYVSASDHGERLGTILATHAPRSTPVEAAPSYANGSTAGRPGTLDVVGLFH
jgi:DNA-binding NarL/FixJ family response regulator